MVWSLARMPGLRGPKVRLTDLHKEAAVLRFLVEKCLTGGINYL